MATLLKDIPVEDMQDLLVEDMQNLSNSGRIHAKHAKPTGRRHSDQILEAIVSNIGDMV